MGGMCDLPFTAETSEEMMNIGMQHLEEAHPDMAASVKAMPKDDPKMVEWMEKFAKDWEALPENE
jgi:hypothetical protein